MAALEIVKEAVICLFVFLLIVLCQIDKIAPMREDMSFRIIPLPRDKLPKLCDITLFQIRISPLPLALQEQRERIAPNLYCVGHGVLDT